MHLVVNDATLPLVAQIERDRILVLDLALSVRCPRDVVLENFGRSELSIVNSQPPQVTFPAIVRSGVITDDKLTSQVFARESESR